MKRFCSSLLSQKAWLVACLVLVLGSVSQGQNPPSPEGGSNPQANGKGAGKGKGNPKSVPSAEALAEAIARDTGGTSEQYRYYSEALAKTLAQLSPEQQARVFSGN